MGVNPPTRWQGDFTAGGIFARHHFENNTFTTPPGDLSAGEGFYCTAN